MTNTFGGSLFQLHYNIPRSPILVIKGPIQCCPTSEHQRSFLKLHTQGRRTVEVEERFTNLKMQGLEFWVLGGGLI